VISTTILNAAQAGGGTQARRIKMLQSNLKKDVGTVSRGFWKP
jgi:hypothetical protein